MGRINQTIAFGPVAGSDRNVIHLSPAHPSARQNEREAIGQLASHTKALADLMVQLSAEVATLNTSGDLSGHLGSVAVGFSRLGKTFSTAGTALDGWDIQAKPQPSTDISSEKNAL
ncbi:hypothetical protein [Devosia sp. SL43]|uniref:hypothetical protein n=1 Tax=Devosia sp. SL43 TaxID=2806348 RepID=UPI001F2C6AE0|nr:hypothetical protein [Devosia sp. SL43]UJW85554.1 hypothetical protein IM737_19520 [Devosia sp. SL43]